MPQTTNFGWNHITTADTVVESNTTFEEINDSFSEDLTLLIDNSNTATLTTAQFTQNFTFIIDEDPGSPTADGAITLLVTNDKRGIFAVENNTAFAVTVDIDGNSPVIGIVVSAGTSKILNTDGLTIMEDG